MASLVDTVDGGLSVFKQLDHVEVLFVAAQGAPAPVETKAVSGMAK
jgi:hypothetical protein